MPLTWVIGSSGLVGQAVWRRGLARGHDLRRVAVPWSASEPEQRAALLQGLDDIVAEADGGEWNLVWVAGAGVVGTPPEMLDTEARVFNALLDSVIAVCDAGRGPRALFVASSAGGVYAGSVGAPFTERSAVAPLAPYGHQKLRVEDTVKQFVRRTGVSSVVGRLTNVYGPGQDLGKAQGLVSQLAKASLLRHPISLYVSLDTIRDYIFVEDAAAVIVAALDDARSPEVVLGAADTPVVKIIGSGSPLTIAALLGEFGRVMRRRPPVVLGDSPNRRFQVRDLRMRSVTWTQLDRLVATTLPTGISATVQDLSRRLRAGQLASR